jgi:hypothetical protein
MLCRMNSSTKLLALVIVALVLGGCAHLESHLSQNSSSPAAAPTVGTTTPKPTPPAKHITVEELKKLRWIEGTWRGTGDVQTPFFERYHFEGPTTLVVEGLADEKVDKVTETSRFELKDGEFGNNEGGSRSVATALDDNSITFDPVTKARNSFRFQKESADSWKATLTWPASDKGPAGQRIYHMERWPKK